MGVLRCGLVWLSIVLATTSAFAGGGTLDSLPGLKDFSAGRQSSFDPSGGNADGRQDKPIEPGETRDMAVISGAGAITHIWVTIASEDPEHLKNLVLRMYWDGEALPSVESPIGDFFGQGNGQYYQYASMPIQIGTNHGLNCFWKMPFRKGARVTITNDSTMACAAFYYYVDYRLYNHLPKKMAYFHAQYRQAYPCKPNENYTFMEATGRGHYVGVNLSIHNRADGWWGEGDDMIYVDGETTPSFNGTGSEDYFCGAWCYGEAFSDLYLGCPLRGEHKTNALWNVYRYHIEDPIPFRKSIKVTIEHGHANDRSDNFSSCAYWYQTEPHDPFPKLPSPQDRKPVELQIYKEKGALEAEDMLTEFTGGPMEVQGTKSYSNDWSNAKHLWFRPAQPTVYTMNTNVPEKMAGTMTVELWYTRAPDYGIVELWLNGVKAAQWDGFNKTGVIRDKIEFPAQIGAGKNTFELRITGKNPESTGFLAGIDCIKPKK
ncbi:MAG TPA: DUF2961 domain-containing protein [Candidatus Hydrogenedentes bacterium]|nr:DUF2961 domain-containing protein [Candidatus Hydrogenedentota bacterium]